MAELSGREAARLTADEPVPPFAAEVLHPLVYVETAQNASEMLRRREREFIALLTEQLSADPGYRVTSALDIRLGADLRAERRQLRETADVVVELDSAAARRDEHPGATLRRPIGVALEGVVRGADRGTDVVHGAGQPFSQCTQRAARLRFIGDVLDLIHDRLRETLAPATRRRRTRRRRPGGSPIGAPWMWSRCRRGPGRLRLPLTR